MSESEQIRVRVQSEYLERFKKLSPDVVKKLGYSRARWNALINSTSPAQVQELIEAGMKYLESLEDE